MYSESSWRNAAAPIIAEVLARGLDVKAQRAALRDAYPFGERRYHPYKIWLDEIARQTNRKPKLGTVRHPPDPRQPPLFEPDPGQDDLFITGGEE